MSVDDSIGRALAYLERQQLSTGAFPIYTWSEPPGIHDTGLDSCTFPSAVISRSLSFVGSSSAAAIRAKVVNFLKREMEPGGVWRHWSSDHQAHAAIPPDVDDIAVVSELLRAEGVNVPDNRPLLLANRDSQGRFYTWVAPRLRWNGSPRYWQIALRQLRRPRLARWFWNSGTARRGDIDCVVNANVLMYLGQGPWTGPVVDFVLECVRQNVVAQRDKWYCRPFSIGYFISRSYSSGVAELQPARDRIVERITNGDRRGPGFGTTPIESAMGICTLLNFNVDADLEGAVHTLVDTQRRDGSWEREEVYRGGPTRWGSDAWTTAFCLEALVRAHARAA